MQVDPCAICTAPALDRYRVVREDLLRLTAEEAVVPLCEPHRRWLETAGEGGRQMRDGVRWRLG